MRHALAVLCFLLSAAGAWAAEAPTSFRQFHLDIVVGEDGRAVQTIHMEVAAANDAAAREIAQQYLSYTDGIERLELTEAYTRKADGSRLPVAEAAVRTQLAPGSPGLPQYTDQKRIIAVLPNLQAGDTAVVTWRRTALQPIFPGFFAQTSFFSRMFPWEDVRVSISVPASRPLQTEAFGPVAQPPEQADGRLVYRWTYQAPARVEDPAVLSPLDRAPRLFASTFRDWTEFGNAWAALIADKRTPSPRVQALADELTAGVDDKRAQAERIYAWVARHVRWVALYVGTGSFVPHGADEVLASGYGDCKDQVMLMLALLRAKGIEAEPVLINLSPTYRLSGPPTFSAFNHVIIYVPALDLYMDTTTRGAPFGTVSAPLYGKPALHVRPEGSAVQAVPVLPPGLATMRLRTAARLDGEGGVTGESVTEASGPYATLLRSVAERIEGEGPERAAAQQLRANGDQGTGRFGLAPLSEVRPEFRVEGRFTLEPQAERLAGDSFPMPLGLRLLARPGDGLLGPMAARNLPATEPSPCYAGEQVEELSLTLPAGVRLARLPRGTRIATGWFTYESRWSQADGTVSVRRTLTSRIDRPLCEGDTRAEAARALAAIRRDQATRIRLDRDEPAPAED